ncbi:hypothetical protein GCM10027184_48170 [Saccharothrix stipae]
MRIKPSTIRRAVAVIAGASVLASAAPAAADRRPTTDVAAIRAQLDLITGADGVPGALAEVRDRRGRSVTITSGTAELGTGRPMVDGDGRFRIASVTKTFVATAVLRLVARHRVRLDAPIETYLPGVVRGTGAGSAINGHDITVRQLLQHTSGLPDYLRFLDLAESTGPVEAAELVRTALSHEPDFAPGAGWRYSNTGYILAGMLVERLTRSDIGTAVTDLVIRPARLDDTYWPPAGEQGIRGPHARNYTVDKAGALVDVTEFEPSWAGAGGAMVSTPSDLNRFWQELLNGRLLPRWALTELQTPVPAPPLGKDVGYGLGTARLPLSCGGHVWAHGGDLANGGIATVSGQDDSGRTATVYITALTSRTAMEHMLHTFDTTFCSQPRPYPTPFARYTASTNAPARTSDPGGPSTSRFVVYPNASRRSTSANPVVPPAPPCPNVRAPTAAPTGGETSNPRPNTCSIGIAGLDSTRSSPPVSGRGRSASVDAVNASSNHRYTRDRPRASATPPDAPSPNAR